jgi:hypothetical protein
MPAQRRLEAPALRPAPDRGRGESEVLLTIIPAMPTYHMCRAGRAGVPVRVFRVTCPQFLGERVAGSDGPSSRRKHASNEVPCTTTTEHENSRPSASDGFSLLAALAIHRSAPAATHPQWVAPGGSALRVSIDGQRFPRSD